MSHFVVLVTNTDEESVESQLEPFYEQGSEKDYFMEKEYFIENNEESVGEWLDNEIQSFNELMKNKDASADNKKWWKKAIKSLKDIQKMDSLEEKLKAIKSYEGCGKDKKGLYWICNPNAKWDWWVIGGRWDGWLVTKEGKRCNSCKVKDIDFDGMRIQDILDRAKWYDKEMEEAKKNNRKPFFWDFKKVPSKIEYCKRGDVMQTPYAVLHDEEWIEKGEMGWFGMSDDKYSNDNWAKKFEEIMGTLDPESEVTIVDCHI